MEDQRKQLTQLAKTRWKFIALKIIVNALLLKERLFQRAPHWVGARAPKSLYFNLYSYILFTVMATVILIATQDIQRGILLFGAFVIPLYGMIRVAHTFTKRLQAIKPERIQVP